jgi:AcrR family transcriptional regulator
MTEGSIRLPTRSFKILRGHANRSGHGKSNMLLGGIRIELTANRFSRNRQGASRGEATRRPAAGHDIMKPDRRQSEGSEPSRDRHRGRQRSGESEEAILCAVIELLKDKALRDISIEEIARKAGVGKATIYKWWPSKAYVALDAFSRKLAQMVTIRDTGSAERDFKEQLRALFAFFETPAGKVLRHFLAEGQIDEEFASLFRDCFIKPRRELIGVIFDRAVERGQIRRGLDREIVLDMIYGPGFYRMLIRHAPLDGDAVDTMVSALFHGLKGRGPQSNRARSRPH